MNTYDSHRLAFGAYYIASEQFDAGQYEDSLEFLSRALSLDPEFADARYLRALTLSNLGRQTEAIDEYTVLLELVPDYAMGYNNRGCLYHESGMLEEAFEDFTECIRHNPTHFKAYNNRGGVKGSQGRYAEAIEDFTKAIELNRAYIRPYVMRAKAYTFLEEFDLAASDLRTARSLGGDDAQLYAIEARLLFWTGDLEAAQEAIRSAWQRDPKDKDLLFLFKEIEVISEENQSEETLPESRETAARISYKNDRVKPYSGEDVYRSHMRPDRDNNIEEMLAEFVLANSVKELFEIVKVRPYMILQPAIEYFKVSTLKWPQIAELSEIKIEALQRLADAVAEKTNLERLQDA